MTYKFETPQMKCSIEFEDPILEDQLMSQKQYQKFFKRVMSAAAVAITAHSVTGEAVHMNELDEMADTIASSALDVLDKYMEDHPGSEGWDASSSANDIHKDLWG